MQAKSHSAWLAKQISYVLKHKRLGRQEYFWRINLNPLYSLDSLSSTSHSAQSLYRKFLEV